MGLLRLHYVLLLADTGDYSEWIEYDLPSHQTSIISSELPSFL